MDWSTLPQPRLRCWIWSENFNIAGCLSLMETFKSFLQIEWQDKTCWTLRETNNTTEKYNILSQVDKGQYCKRISECGHGLLASDTSDTACSSTGSELFFSTFPQWKRIYCSWTDLPLYFKENKRLIFNHSNPFYIRLKMHFITGCKVRRQHRLLSLMTSHYSVLRH